MISSPADLFALRPKPWKQDAVKQVRLRQAGGLALADMRLPDVVALPVLRDHQNADLHLALRQRRELVEEGPDPLHATGDGRTVDPDLVGPEDAPASGGELIEDLALLG